MAYKTDGTTNTTISSASAIDLSAWSAFSISLWLWWDTFANDAHLLGELSTDGYNNAGCWYIDPNSSTALFLANFRVLIGGGHSTATFARPSAAAWHHYVFQLDSTDVASPLWKNIWIDG